MTLYEASYFQMRASDEHRRTLAYAQEYERVKSRLHFRGYNVLDIGCGTGGFLELFQRDGWQAFGIEVSEYCIRQCIGRGIAMIDYDAIVPNSFDLVIMRGVLQHLDDPFYSLHAAKRALDANGLLAILAQPDADSLCYRLFGELPALDPPRNWWIPGRRELVNIIQKLNFRNIEVMQPYWGGPYANPPRDFARFVGRLFGLRRPFAFPGNMIEVYARA